MPTSDSPVPHRRSLDHHQSIGDDDEYVNVYMGPNAQKHSLDDFNADNFDHGGLKFIRGGQISVSPADLEGGPIRSGE